MLFMLEYFCSEHINTVLSQTVYKYMYFGTSNTDTEIKNLLLHRVLNINQPGLLQHILLRLVARSISSSKLLILRLILS